MRQNSNLNFQLAVLGAVVAALVPSANAQSTPTAPTMTLNYENVPLDTILSETSDHLGFIIVRQQAFPQRMTVISGKPLDTTGALTLLNESLWSLGYRITATKANEATSRVVAWIVALPTWKNPAEMRIWRPVVPVLAPRKKATDFPGIQQSVTMKLEFVNEQLGNILEAFGKQWGVEIADSGKLQQPLTVVTPRPVTAWQAVNVINDLLFAHDQLLEVATGAGGKTILKVVENKAKSIVENEEIPLKFESAPLESVLDELAKDSGYKVRNTVPAGVKVSLDDSLRKESIGIDIGPAVAHLNEILEKDGAVILETLCARDDGELEPLLRVMPLNEAKQNCLGPVLESRPLPLPETEWLHVDKESTMTFMYKTTPVRTILTDVSKRFGFELVADAKLDIPVTLSNPRALDAVTSLKLANDILYPLGYTAIVVPLPEVDATELRIVALRELKEFAKSGRFKTAEK